MYQQIKKGVSKMFRTKKEFLEFFKEEYLPYIREKEKEYGRVDRIMRYEEWNNAVDFYIKDKMLPKKAYDWSNPF